MRRQSKRKQATKADSLQKLQIAEDVFMDPYAPFCCPAQICDREAHAKKKNCGSNPWCLYGLGEGKDGIWKTSPTCITKLGLDPHTLVRKKDPASMKFTPPVGLKNLGATCYLNVLMQSLFHNHMIRDAVFNMKVAEQVENSKNGIAASASSDDSRIALIVEALQMAFGHMESCSKAVYDLDYFTELLGLDTGEQQDPQEFNKLFMARVESFRLPVHIPSFPTIGKLISGKERYSTTCTVCGNSSGQLHEFHELDLSIEGHSSVTGALEGYMAEERLFGDNCYECSHCQKKQEAIRRTEIVETPDILFLQLLRYVYDRKTYEKKKSKVEISFPDELTLNGEEYKLVAVLYHKGQSAYGGHYVAELLEWSSIDVNDLASSHNRSHNHNHSDKKEKEKDKAQEEQWWFCDDDQVVRTDNPAKAKQGSSSNGAASGPTAGSAPKEAGLSASSSGSSSGSKASGAQKEVHDVAPTKSKGASAPAPAPKRHVPLQRLKAVSANPSATSDDSKIEYDDLKPAAKVGIASTFVRKGSLRDDAESDAMMIIDVDEDEVNEKSMHVSRTGSESSMAITAAAESKSNHSRERSGYHSGDDEVLVVSSDSDNEAMHVVEGDDEESYFVAGRGRRRRATGRNGDDEQDSDSDFEDESTAKKRGRRGKSEPKGESQAKIARGNGGGRGRGRGRGRPPLANKDKKMNSRGSKKAGDSDSESDSGDDAQVEEESASASASATAEDAEDVEGSCKGKGKGESTKRGRKSGKTGEEKKPELLKLNRLKDAYMLAYVKKSSLLTSMRRERIAPSPSVEAAVEKSCSVFEQEVATYEKHRALLDEEIAERKKLYEEVSAIWHPEGGIEGRFHLIPTLWLQQWITGEKKDSEGSSQSQSQSQPQTKSDSTSGGGGDGVVDLTETVQRVPFSSDAHRSSLGAGESKSKDPGEEGDDKGDAFQQKDSNSGARSAVSLFRDGVSNGQFLCRHFHETGCGANPRCASSVKVISEKAFENILWNLASRAGLHVRTAPKGYQSVAGISVNDPGLSSLIDYDLNERNFLCTDCRDESNMLRSQLQSDLDSNETLLALLEEEVPIPDLSALGTGTGSGSGSGSAAASANNSGSVDKSTINTDENQGRGEGPTEEVEWVGDEEVSWKTAAPHSSASPTGSGRIGAAVDGTAPRSPRRSSQDESEDQQKFYWISKTWVTAFKRHIETLRRKKDKSAAAALNEPTQKKRRGASANANSDADLSAALAASAREAGISEDVMIINGDDSKAAKQALDETVNSSIVCPHGKLAGSQRRRVRLVTALAWEALAALYPRAIALPFECMVAPSERSGQESDWLCRACEQGQAAAANQRESQRAVRADEVAEKCMLTLSAPRKSQAAGRRRYPPEFDELQNLVEPLANTSWKHRSFSLIETAWLQRWRDYITSLECPRPGPLTNSKLKCPHGLALIPHYLARIPQYVTPASCAETAYDEGGNFPAVELITQEQFDHLVRMYGQSSSHRVIDGHDRQAQTHTQTHTQVHEDWETRTETEDDPQSGSPGGASSSSSAHAGTHDAVYGVHLQLNGTQWCWSEALCQICAANAKVEVDRKRCDFDNYCFQVIIIRPDEPLPEEAGGVQAAATTAASAIDVTSEKRGSDDGVVIVDDEKGDSRAGRTGSFDASVFIPGRRRSTRRAGQKNNRIRVALSSDDTISLAKMKIYQEMVIEDSESSLQNSTLIYRGKQLTTGIQTLREYGVMSGVDPIYYKMAYGEGDDGITSLWAEDNGRRSEAGFKNTFLGGAGSGSGNVSSAAAAASTGSREATTSSSGSSSASHVNTTADKPTAAADAVDGVGGVVNERKYHRKPAERSTEPEAFPIDEGRVESIIDITGKSRDEVIAALLHCKNDPDAAANKLMQE